MKVGNEFRIIDKRFRRFLFLFFTKKFDFKYRKQILICANLGRTIFPVFLDDLFLFDKKLFNLLLHSPFLYLNNFEFSINRLINNFSFWSFSEKKISNKLQIFLIWKESPVPINRISNLKFNRLINLKVKILSISSMKMRIDRFDFLRKEGKLENLVFSRKFEEKNFYSKNFQEEKNLNSENHMTPQKNFIGFQIVKAKELLGPNTHEKQHSFSLWLILERGMTNILSPGNQIIITGAFIPSDTFEEEKIKKENSHKKFIFQVLGFFFYEQKYSSVFFSKTQLFYRNFLAFAKTRKVFDWIFSSISPDLLGFEKIKKGAACLLFGGTERDSSRQSFYSGHLNILMIGDPFDVKQKLFNFIRKLSGRDSPTLTLKELMGSNYWLVKNKGLSSDFLATELIIQIGDTGVICVENLENFKTNERMVLYSLTKKHLRSLKRNDSQKFSKNLPILASIKPVNSKGKFFRSPLDSPTIENMDFWKFDLVFFLSDKHSTKFDRKMFKRTFSSFRHTKDGISVKEDESKETNFEMLRTYINFCRYKFAPKISKKARVLLQNAYLFMRISQRKNFWVLNENIFPISVRNLESMIKISESLSKMRMSNLVNSSDALDAIKIIKEGNN